MSVKTFDWSRMTELPAKIERSLSELGGIVGEIEKEYFDAFATASMIEQCETCREFHVPLENDKSGLLTSTCPVCAIDDLFSIASNACLKLEEGDIDGVAEFLMAADKSAHDYYDGCNMPAKVVEIGREQMRATRFGESDFLDALEAYVAKKRKELSDVHQG